MKLLVCLSLPLAAVGLLAALPAPAQTVYTVPSATPYPQQNQYQYPQQGRGRRGRNRNNPNNPYNQNGQGGQNSGANGNQAAGSAQRYVPKPQPPGPVDNEDSVNTAPAVSAGGVLYFGSWNHEVTALDENTGAVRWKFTAGDIINASPTIGPDGNVYFTCRDKNVYALDGKTGAKLWQFPTAGRLATRPRRFRRAGLCRNVRQGPQSDRPGCQDRRKKVGAGDTDGSLLARARPQWSGLCFRRQAVRIRRRDRRDHLEPGPQRPARPGTDGRPDRYDLCRHRRCPAAGPGRRDREDVVDL